jgi:uncharacterized protein (DUF2147 family)
MDDNTITLLGITGNVYVMFAVALLLLALWILWVVLPFIVYFIWRRIEETLDVNKLILLELSKMNGEISDFTSESEIGRDIESESDNPITQNKPITQNCSKCGKESSIEVMDCVFCGHRMPRI